MGSTKAAVALGLDFGTTNTVAALADAAGNPRLVEFAGAEATGPVFRTALCFWEDEQARNGVAHDAGPWGDRRIPPVASRQSLRAVLQDGRGEPALRTGADLQSAVSVRGSGKIVFAEVGRTRRGSAGRSARARGGGPTRRVCGCAPRSGACPAALRPDAPRIRHRAVLRSRAAGAQRSVTLLA